MMQRDSFESTARRIYRALIRFYPGGFRDSFALDMEESFADQLRDARKNGPVETIRFFMFAAFDATRSGLRERISSPSDSSSMVHWMDVRYAARLLRRSPVFTLLTVLVLSGGLGVAIFTFSFLHTAMLKPIPIADGARVVRVMQAIGDNDGPFDAVDLAEMRAGITSLADVGVYTSQSLIVSSDEHPRVIDATVAEWNIFSFTRTVPVMGRVFTANDALLGAEPTIVLAHRTWQTAFGSDSAIVGKTVLLNGQSTRVIGVMPPAYGFPVAARAWMPLSEGAIKNAKAGQQAFELYGRLASGRSSAQARSEISVLFKRAREHARFALSVDSARIVAAIDARSDVSVQTFPMAQMGGEGPLMLAILNVLAGLILLLACINVTNLLLARSNERVRETAVRLALGASRARLIMQSMWESVLLCLAGGIVATGIAAWGLDAINRWAAFNLEGNLAFWWVWQLDRSSLIAAASFVSATIAVLGTVVAARATNLQFVAVLKDGSARSGSRREGRAARALVVTQVATVSVLMFFGVLAGIVAYRVANVDVGFDTRNVITARLGLDDARYASQTARNTFYRIAIDAMQPAPTASGALIRSGIADIADENSTVETGAQSGRGAATKRAYQQALEGDVATLGMSVVEGRSFDDRDSENGAPVAVVSRSFAIAAWPGASPIGKQIRLAGTKAESFRTVVGVLSNIPFGSPFSKSRSDVAVYVPLLQSDARNLEIVLRHRGSAEAAQANLYHALALADSKLLPPDIQSYDEMLAKSALIARSTAKLFGGCFTFALLIAVSGTYGLMARSIGQRTREIGVRRALGASNSHVMKLLLLQGAKQLGVGVLFSVPLMIAVGIGFSKIFPVGFALTFMSGVLVCLSIVGVVLIATFVPTQHAIGIELREALWKE